MLGWKRSWSPVELRDARHRRGSGLCCPHSRSLLSPQPYLGFVDGAVQSVVLLVVEQAEIQRPQRGCKGSRDAIKPGRHGLLSPRGVERSAWGC